MENKRYNRIEANGRHRYLNEFAPTPVGSIKYPGFIKCRMAHGAGYSLIPPDQLYLAGPPLRWLQPLYFTAPSLSRFPDGRILCDLAIDVSFGRRLWVEFWSDALVARLPDCSEVYRCEISGPSNLLGHATGIAGNISSPELTLFHHTTAESKRLLLEGRVYRLSHWNIAGTKQIANYGYVYFTALNKIANDDDLVQIAMSSEGVLRFLVDNGDASRSSDVLELPVYRASSSARQNTLSHVIPAYLLAPQHLLRHSSTGIHPVYYEVMNPFTYRIGLAPGDLLRFGPPLANRVEVPNSWKNPDHIVVGDATTRVGIAAPYEEDTTLQLAKLHGCAESKSVLEEWFRLGNTDQYSPRNPELHKYKGS